MSVSSYRFVEPSVRQRIVQVLLTVVICFALAAFAQRRLDRRLSDYRAFVAYGLAGVIFAVAFGDIALESAAEPDASILAGAPARYAMTVGTVAALLGIALLGCLDFGDNRFRLMGLMLWGGGLCMCLAYLYGSDGPRTHRGRFAAVLSGKPLTIPRHWLLLGIAVLVGAILRLYQLDAIPADIGWDLPYNYFDVLSILRGEYRIFYPANMGREALFFYLAALVARFAPLSHFSLKLTSALVGIATIPALYLAAQQTFNRPVALGAAFLLAVNRWHIVLSRAGFRVILLPLFCILLLYALVRALQSYRLFDFALAGLVLGLGLYTYTSFLFAPLAILVGFALYSWSARPGWRLLLPLLALMIAVAVVVYAPMGRFAIEHPKEYGQRAALQMGLLKGGKQGAAITWPLFMENLRASVLMYHVQGDGTNRFSVPYLRHLGFVSGALLVLGLFYSFRRFLRGAGFPACALTKTEKPESRVSIPLLLAMFFILILPMTLTMLPHETPNIFRSAGTIGPALILAALPMAAIARRLKELSVAYPLYDLLLKLRISSLEQAHELALQIGRRGLLALAPALIVALLLVVEGKETVHFYFHDFVQVLPDRQNVSIAKEMARQIELYGDRSSCYIKVWPHWYDGKALATYLRQEDSRLNLEFVNFVPDQPPLSLVNERALFLLHPADSEGLAMLQEVFARHVVVPHRFPDGEIAFLAVYVER